MGTSARSLPRPKVRPPTPYIGTCCRSPLTTWKSRDAFSVGRPVCSLRTFVSIPGADVDETVTHELESRSMGDEKGTLRGVSLFFLGGRNAAGSQRDPPAARSGSSNCADRDAGSLCAPSRCAV